jgi:pyruvate-formate lyase
MNIIFPQVYAELQAFLSDVSARRSVLLNGRKINVMNAYPDEEAEMPAVVIEEKQNTESAEAKELDAYETLSNIVYEVGIYDNSETKVAVCYELTKDINEFFMGLEKTVMKFSRTYSSPIPNAIDPYTHRHLMRFQNIK